MRLAFLESKEFARLDKDSFNTIIEQKDVTFLLVNLHLFVQHALPSCVVHLEQYAPDYLQALALIIIRKERNLFP